MAMISRTNFGHKAWARFGLRAGQWAATTALAASLAACATMGRGSPPAMAGNGTPEIPIDTMKEVTRTLSSDAFEGRAPGTEGERKTIALLKERFAAAGLQPGNNGSWVQKVPLIEMTGADYSPMIVKGGGQAIRLAPGDDYVAVSYRVTPETRIEDSEIVFVGYGINAPEKGWNDYAGIDMTGKTALILVNDPDYDADTLDGPFGGRAMTYYGRWTYKFEEAARQGATAALIVHDTFPAAYGWNVVQSSWTGAQAYAQTADDGASQTRANGWVQKPMAERIMTMAGQDLAAMTAAAKRKGFAAVPLGVTTSFGFDSAIRRFESNNVIGVLPGSERPDEVVLYTAHWDHLGRCKADETGDDICNGAIDNATGTAALVALAEAHVKAGAPERSIAFVAVTAEESGLLGSEYYAANPVFPLDQTVGGVNMDALSLAGPANDVVVVGGGKSELDAYLDDALGELGRTATPEPTPEKGYYYRSDHFSLAKRGVPMFYVESGEDLIEGGTAAGAAAAADYTENRYHGPQDEYDPDWNWDGAEQDLRLFYRLGRSLANTGAWPNWLDGDEFRRIRDESCAASDTGC
ncbi:M28 family metallopeptidase [Croceicoccus hydrothermalis]|uniref:M28 family metallopeptidase n=1 Tax=Croceicoccus hydrothermalis TaxID=2867964 RepID=UPI003B834C04